MTLTDLEPMTLIYELDLGILNTCMYHMRTKNEVSIGQGSQTLESKKDTHAERERHTDAIDRITAPYW